MSKARKDTWLESDDFLRELDQILELSKSAKIKREIIGWEGYEELHDYLQSRDVSESAMQAVMNLIIECRELRNAKKTKDFERTIVSFTHRL